MDGLSFGSFVQSPPLDWRGGVSVMREKEREREAIHLTLAVATGGLGVERSVAVQDALHGRRLAARGRAATTKLHPPPRTIHTPHASYSVSVMCCCGLRRVKA